MYDLVYVTRISRDKKVYGKGTNKQTPIVTIERYRRFCILSLQLDGAPGHITSIICRIAAETGRKIVWTPPGTSGYVQPADDIINASFQSGFMKVHM